MRNKVSETKKGKKREDDYEEEMRNKVSETKKGRKEGMTTRKKKQR